MEKKVHNDDTIHVEINGRPFTPHDLANLDKLNEEYQEQNPPKPLVFSVADRHKSHVSWFFNSLTPRDMFLERPIILD